MQLFWKTGSPQASSTAFGWRVFIERVAGSSGLLLFLAGIIFFMAWNWQDMHRFLKFAVVEFVFALLGLYVFFRWKHWSADIALLGLGTAIGALLALYGQVYQTGADAWELFRAWCLVLIPLAALRLRAGLVFLLWLVASLWMLLYMKELFDSRHIHSNLDSLYFIIPQLCFWVVAEVLAIIGRGAHFDSHRLLPRCVGTAALACLTFSAMEQLVSSSGYDRSMGMVIPIYCGTLSALGVIYLKRIPDLFFLSLGVFSLAAFICVAATQAVLEGRFFKEGSLLLLGIFYIGAFIGGAKLIFVLRAHIAQRRGEPPDEGQPWYMKIPLTVGVWLGALLIVAFLAITIGYTLEHTGMGILGLFLTGLGIALSRLGRDKFVISQLALASLFSGVILSGFLTDFSFASPETNILYTIIFLALWGGLETPLAKIICFAAALHTFLLWLSLYSGATLAWGLRALWVPALAWAIWYMNFSEGGGPKNATGRPLAGALGGLLLFTMTMAMTDVIPKVYLWAGWHWSLAAIVPPSAAFALAAFTIACCVKRRAAAPLIFPAGALLSLAAWFAPAIALGLTLAATGRQRGNFKLMVLGLVYLAVAVVLYYYFMDVSLLRKSVILMLTGLALLALALAARRLFGWASGGLEVGYE